MSNKSNSLINFVIFMIITLLITGLQTSLWSNYLGSFPSPHVWIPVLVYWCLYRSAIETILMAYILSLIVAPMTAMPFGLFLFVNMCLVIVTLIFKIKFYQTGSIYFAANVATVTFLFVPFFLITSFVFDRSFFSFNVYYFDWIIKIILTTMASIPLHALFSYIDNITRKRLPTETGRGIA